jgi:hypothetical protein
MPKQSKEARIPRKPVRLEVFSIQGHNGSKPLNYSEFFEFIQGLSAKTRQDKVADRVIAVPVFRKIDSRYAFTAYWGSTDRSFLVFDTDTQKEEIRFIEDGKIMATRTVGVIDPVTHQVVIQYVHTGVRAAQIATLFEKLAHEVPNYEGTTLEFAPVAGRSFREQLASMDRIQAAEFTMTRPNYDWGDYENQLASLAGDSNARRIEVSAAARPQESLSKNRGVVQIINKLAEGSKSILKTANIKGFVNGQSAPILLNLNKHIDSKTVSIPLEADGYPSSPQIIQAGSNLLNERSTE